jgi:hypothetical protein
MQMRSPLSCPKWLIDSTSQERERRIIVISFDYIEKTLAFFTGKC